MSLANAGRSKHQDVGGFGDQGQVGQLLDLALIGGGLEGKVKLLQVALKGEMGHLGPQQLLQHLRIGQQLAGSGVEGVVQDIGGPLEALGLEILARLLQGRSSGSSHDGQHVDVRRAPFHPPTGICTAIVSRR